MRELTKAQRCIAAVKESLGGEEEYEAYGAVLGALHRFAFVTKAPAGEDVATWHRASPALGARVPSLVTTWPLFGRRRSDD